MDAVETASQAWTMVHLGLSAEEIRAVDDYRVDSYRSGDRDKIPTRPGILREALTEYLGKRGHPFPAKNQRRTA